ncbi:MAG: carbohydrate kinase [Cyanobacteria bacterium P01_H01_bin.121]
MPRQIEPQVICLGEVLFDKLADQTGSELASVQSWTRYPGGAPANVATGLAKLGISSALLSCLGQDADGDELLRLLTEVGVNTLGIQRQATAPTRVVEVLRDRQGQPTFAGFGGRSPDRFADTYLDAQHLPNELFVTADYLVLGTLVLAYPAAGIATQRAIQLAQHYDLAIFLDLNWRPMFWLNPADAATVIWDILTAVHYLKLTTAEADWFFNSQDLNQIAACLADRHSSIQLIVMTAGDQGCHYWLRSPSAQPHIGWLPAFQVLSVDSTGAGDAFLAGLILDLRTPSIIQHYYDTKHTVLNEV